MSIQNNGNVVRHIAFTYKRTYESPSPRTLLADITVKDGGTLVDHQTFEYYDAPSSTQSEDKFIIDTPAYKLMHELVGHAIPFIRGYASTDIPAAINENKCRKEIGVPLRNIYIKDTQLKLKEQ